MANNTISDIEQQLAQTRQDISQARQNIETSRTGITRAVSDIRTPVKRIPYLTRKQREAQRVFLEKTAPTALEELQQFETQQIAPVEQQLTSAEQQLEKNKEQQELYDRAKNWAIDFYYGDKRAAILAGSLLNQGSAGRKAYQYYEDYLQYLRDKDKEPTQELYEINPIYADLNYTPAVLPEDYFVPISTTVTEPTSPDYGGYSYERLVFTKTPEGYYKQTIIPGEVRYEAPTITNIQAPVMEQSRILSSLTLAKSVSSPRLIVTAINPLLQKVGLPTIPQAVPDRINKQFSPAVREVFDKITYSNKSKAVVITDDLGNRVLVEEGKVSRLNNLIQDIKESLGIKSLNPEDVKVVKGLSIAVLMASVGAGAYLQAGTLLRTGLSAKKIQQYINSFRNSVAVFTPSVYTAPADYLYEIIPTPVSGPGKFTKGALASAIITTRAPLVGVSYLSKLLVPVIKDPYKGTTDIAQGFIQNPWENIGFIAGGSTRLRSALESGIRRSFGGTKYKIDKINVPKYGEVKIIKTDKYGDIAYVEGKFAQTEKLRLVEQLKLANYKGRVVFTSATPSGIPLSQAGKGVGFEVIEVSKPLRGFYEAPKMKFLEALYKEIRPEGAIATYYLESGRDRILPTAKDLKKLLTGEEALAATKRPMAILGRRQYPKMEKWIIETGISLNSGKGIPSKYKPIIEKLYNEFLNETINWEGQNYSGKNKVQLVNNINLRGRGSGEKLKVYVALIQYQLKTGRELIGGAEDISGILPYGPESQIVSALGTKFYRRDIKDLRQAKMRTKLERVTQLLTGTQRGQAFANVEGKLIEFEFMRKYPKGTKRPKTTIEQKNINNFLTESKIKYYHGTDLQSAKKILQTGLNPNSWITTSKTRALDYVGENGVLLEIYLTRSQIEKLQLHPRQFASAEKTKFLSKEKISPENIISKDSDVKNIIRNRKIQTTSDILTEALTKTERARERIPESQFRPRVPTRGITRNIRVLDRLFERPREREFRNRPDIIRINNRLTERPRERITQRPPRIIERPRERPPRIRITTDFLVPNLDKTTARLPDKREKQKIEKRTYQKVSGLPEYQLLPTATQIVYGLKAQKVSRKLTGFELARL